MPHDLPDSLQAWMDAYMSMAVQGVRSEAVVHKIALHLRRFPSNSSCICSKKY